MPLPNEMSKDIFSDIGNPVAPAKVEIPKAEPIEQEPQQPVKQRVKRPKKQAEGKVSCTFHLPQSMRENPQALSFVTRTPQNQLVEDAIASLIKRKGVELPSRAA